MATVLDVLERLREADLAAEDPVARNDAGITAETTEYLAALYEAAPDMLRVARIGMLQHDGANLVGQCDMCDALAPLLRDDQPTRVTSSVPDGAGRGR